MDGWLVTRRPYHKAGRLRVENGRVQVQCYWGANAPEYPDRFTLGDHGYAVEELLDRWYGKEDTYLKLRAGDGNIYILRHNSASDTWPLESFRRA